MSEDDDNKEGMRLAGELLRALPGPHAVDLAQDERPQHQYVCSRVATKHLAASTGRISFKRCECSDLDEPHFHVGSEIVTERELRERMED